MEYVLVVVYLVVIILMIAGMWKVFEKAGQPGWAAIVPIYNAYVLTCQVAKKEIVWLILMFIPCVGLIASIMVAMEVGRKFGKSDGFGIGLAFLPFIFYPMLGFSDARYQGGKRQFDEYDDEFDDEEEEPRPKKKKRYSDDD